MRRPTFIGERIVEILREREADAETTDPRRGRGIGGETRRARRAGFGGMEIFDAKRPTSPAREGPRPKRSTGDAGGANAMTPKPGRAG